MFAILVIDDQINIHNVFQRILVPGKAAPSDLLTAEAALFGTLNETREEASFQLTFALCGEDGVAAVRAAITPGGTPFAMAFVDMRMGGIDGRETVRQIWEIDPKMQIVFCTAHSEHSWAELAAIGPDDRWLFICKDFSPMEIKQVTHAMTAKWQRERELEILRAKAEAANVAKSEFLCNMSHELRTPNHAIGSFISFALEAFGVEQFEYAKIAETNILATFESLKKEALNAAGEGNLAEFLQERLGKIPRWLLKAYRNNAELVQLLDDILDLAKLEAGQMTFFFQVENLLPMFCLVAEGCEGLCAARKIKLVINPDHAENMPILAEVDSGKIMQVFRNLLGNALKFSPDEATIRVEMIEHEQTVLFSITDQGPGIDEKDLEKIFDKFFQSARTADGAGGTGLGLPICREYVARHQGRIWAENNSGGGSTFFVELPRKRGASSTHLKKH